MFILDGFSNPNFFYKPAAERVFNLLEKEKNRFAQDSIRHNMTGTLENLQVTRVIDKKIYITCPKCTKTTAVDLNNKSNLLGKFIVKYKCKCGNIGEIKLEKRVSYRKAVHLNGAIKKDGKPIGSVTITDLSKTGCRFEANPRIKLQVGDSLELGFRLDDKNRSLIRQKGVIRNSNDCQYGFEFIRSDRQLGFYFL